MLTGIKKGGGKEFHSVLWVVAEVIFQVEK